MTNLEKLEKDIREKLPRLVELTEGCELNYMGIKFSILKRNEAENLFTLTSDDIPSYTVQSIHHVESKCEVIGHPVMLNDVLEWLGIKAEYIDEYAIDSAGKLLKFDDDYGYEYLGKKWDLFKPYLKDQPQELIDYLASLI